LSHQLIEIYTDGSCHPQFNLGAWAAIIFVNSDKTIIDGIARHTTHNRMELLAVIEAINFTNKNYPNASIVIYTDSQYVSNIPDRKDKLKKNLFLTKKGIPLQNTDLVKTLIQQIESRQIKFIKVIAHQQLQKDGSNYSINYNSEVDKLVRKMVRDEVKRLR
jgi:ribonuclease HI